MTPDPKLQKTTLEATQRVIALVTAMNHDDHDLVYELLAADPDIESTLCQLIVCCSALSEVLAEHMGIDRDGILQKVGVGIASHLEEVA